MARLSTYHFRGIDQSSLSLGDIRDPFRFYHSPQREAASEKSASASFDLLVQDVDQNRQIDEKDRFIYVNARGEQLLLQAPEALKLLNYYVDPDKLRASHLGMVVSHSDEEPLAANQFPQSVEALPHLSFRDLTAIREEHFPYWEVDGHLDLDILEGLRIYTSEENSRWTGIRGVPIYFNGKFFRNKVLAEKGLIALSFIGVEYLTSAPFVWQTYTTNFFSMIGGSLSENNREEGIIHAGLLYADGESTHASTRRLINIQTAKSRSILARDHLYWTVTWPVVLAACFADPHFRVFWPAPWRAPRFGVLYNYFSNQFSRAIPFMGRSALGLGAAALSGYGIYELSSLWFDIYGHMPQGSTENRAFSAGATLLTQAALYSRASREMMALTGESRLTMASLGRIQQMSWRLRPRIEMGRMNLFGLKFPFPRASLNMEVSERWMRRLPSAAEAEGAETLAAKLPLRATFVRSGGGLNILEREVFARFASGEMLVGERAGLSVASRLATPLVEEEMLAAESLMIRSRMRMVGLPLLGVAALAGAAIGLGYLTGFFNSERNPRRFIREKTGL